MPETDPGVSDEAVAEATGRDWAAWVGTLDDAGAVEQDHRTIVSLVAAAGVESGWWQQTVAVGYERLRGLRTVGETADAGFQIGVQRTLSVPQEQLWAQLMSPRGVAAWLGETDGVDLEPGARYETADGTTGEVRTVKPAERLRLTWQPVARDAPTTLQLSLACPRNDGRRTTLRFHHEKLADAAERERMRDHWRAALDRIEALVDR